MVRILWIVAALIVGVWLLGVIFRIAGNLIHLLLLVAVLVILWNLISGRRAA